MRTKTMKTTSAGKITDPEKVPVDASSDLPTEEAMSDLVLAPPFDGLPPELVSDLAEMYGVPAWQADASVQLLEFGFRAALVGVGCLEHEGNAYHLTKRGLELIGLAHTASMARLHGGTVAQARRDVEDSIAELVARRSGSASR